jgi:hypothetical protein
MASSIGAAPLVQGPQGPQGPVHEGERVVLTISNRAAVTAKGTDDIAGSDTPTDFHLSLPHVSLRGLEHEDVDVSLRLSQWHALDGEHHNDDDTRPAVVAFNAPQYLHARFTFTLRASFSDGRADHVQTVTVPPTMLPLELFSGGGTTGSLAVFKAADCGEHGLESFWIREPRHIVGGNTANGMSLVTPTHLVWPYRAQSSNVVGTRELHLTVDGQIEAPYDNLYLFTVPVPLPQVLLRMCRVLRTLVPEADLSVKAQRDGRVVLSRNAPAPGSALSAVSLLIEYGPSRDLCPNLALLAEDMFSPLALSVGGSITLSSNATRLPLPQHVRSGPAMLASLSARTDLILTETLTKAVTITDTNGAVYDLDFLPGVYTPATLAIVWNMLATAARTAANIPDGSDVHATWDDVSSKITIASTALQIHSGMGLSSDTVEALASVTNVADTRFEPWAPASTDGIVTVRDTTPYRGRFSLRFHNARLRDALGLLQNEYMHITGVTSDLELGSSLDHVRMHAAADATGTHAILTPHVHPEMRVTLDGGNAVATFWRRGDGSSVSAVHAFQAGHAVEVQQGTSAIALRLAAVTATTVTLQVPSAVTLSGEATLTPLEGPAQEYVDWVAGEWAWEGLAAGRDGSRVVGVDLMGPSLRWTGGKLTLPLFGRIPQRMHHLFLVAHGVDIALRGFHRVVGPGGIMLTVLAEAFFDAVSGLCHGLAPTAPVLAAHMPRELRLQILDAATLTQPSDLKHLVHTFTFQATVVGGGVLSRP